MKPSTLVDLPEESQKQGLPRWPGSWPAREGNMGKWMGNRITVLLADDTASIRKVVLGFLHWESSIKVVGAAENFSQTIEMATDLKPDVVLLDLHMPDHYAFAPALVKSKLLL